MGVYVQDWMGLDGGTQKRRLFKPRDIISYGSCQYFVLWHRSKPVIGSFFAARRKFLWELQFFRVQWHHSKGSLFFSFSKRQVRDGFHLPCRLFYVILFTSKDACASFSPCFVATGYGCVIEAPPCHPGLMGLVLPWNDALSHRCVHCHGVRMTFVPRTRKYLCALYWAA